MSDRTNSVVERAREAATIARDLASQAREGNLASRRSFPHAAHPPLPDPQVLALNAGMIVLLAGLQEQLSDLPTETEDGYRDPLPAGRFSERADDLIEALLREISDDK